MFISKKIVTTAAAAALLSVSGLAMAGEGIWKAAIPHAGSMKGEFDNNDPIGLSAGVAIKADCSLNWTDPDDHKLYCFSSATSLVFFLDSPAHYLDSARESWDRLSATPGCGSGSAFCASAACKVARFYWSCNLTATNEVRLAIARGTMRFQK